MNDHHIDSILYPSLNSPLYHDKQSQARHKTPDNGREFSHLSDGRHSVLCTPCVKEDHCDKTILAWKCVEQCFIVPQRFRAWKKLEKMKFWKLILVGLSLKKRSKSPISKSPSSVIQFRNFFHFWDLTISSSRGVQRTVNFQNFICPHLLHEFAYQDPSVFIIASRPLPSLFLLNPQNMETFLSGNLVNGGNFSVKSQYAKYAKVSATKLVICWKCQLDIPTGALHCNL